MKCIVLGFINLDYYTFSNVFKKEQNQPLASMLHQVFTLSRLMLYLMYRIVKEEKIFYKTANATSNLSTGCSFFSAATPCR
jgi:hypothetical protein